MNNLNEIAERLKQNQVVAYPTEAVFGLGCNPNSEQAVRFLLNLKNRPEEKGLILLASNLELLKPFIDESQMSQTAWQQLETIGEQAITWVVPAKNNVPRYLKGKFNSIAVRICHLPAIVQLCKKTGFAITSTSANLSGLAPCRTVQEVQTQFGKDFPVLAMPTGGKTNPSEIRDIFSQQILREG